MLNIDDLPDMKHCHTDYTLKEAVSMVCNHPAQIEPLDTIEEVQAELAETIRYRDFIWITGQRAMELITAFIENKPIEEVAVRL